MAMDTHLHKEAARFLTQGRSTLPATPVSDIHKVFAIQFWIIPDTRVKQSIVN